MRYDIKTIRNKDDIEFHYDYGQPNPAVNVKVNTYLRSVKLPICLGGSSKVGESEITWDYTDPAFTHDWVEENISDEHMQDTFDVYCEFGFEQLQDEAEEIWPDYSVKVYSEGRSGGWATVHGLPDTDEWDAVMLGKWRRFAKIARLAADDVPYQMMTDFYMNSFEGEDNE